MRPPVRSLLLSVSLLAVATACADAPTMPVAQLPTAPSFRVGDPPPPPADGEPVPVAPCFTDICYVLFSEVAGLGVRILQNPPSTVAFLQFSSTNPDVVVSPSARIRETAQGIVGQGTITIVSASLGVITADLSTVQQYSRVDSQVSFTTSLTDPSGAPVIRNGTLYLALFNYSF